MPRPSLIRAALAGILALAPACAGAFTPAAAAPAQDADPLVVHLDTISPVLPRSGNVEITGTVTNVSDDTFTRINLHAFSSQSPILTSASLAESAAIDPSLYVGERVTVPGTFDTVDVLAPGESAAFADSVPVELLEIPDEAGVYWIGIHALGDGAIPRDAVADGRARSFIATRPTGGRTQETAIILPVRHRVWYDVEGRIGGTQRWARRLEEDGALDSILDAADAAGSTPYSWLVDPAVLVALVRLAMGNAPRSLAPDPAIPEQAPAPPETPTDGATSDPTDPAESLTPSVPAPTEEQTEEELALSAAASAWLTRFLDLAASSPVLALPFGDLDVSAAVRNGPERYADALARSAQVMGDLGLPFEPAVAPASDLMSAEAIAATPDEVTILLGDNAFVVPPRSPHAVVRLLGHEIILTSTGAEAGGPAPTAGSDPLALRQRLLSEAALRLADRDTAPLVVTLPVWRGEDAEAFFDDLEQPWLDVVPVTFIVGRSARGVPSSSLLYSDSDLEAELDASSFTAATRATDAAALVEEVLFLKTTIEAQVRDEVLVTLSEQHRPAPRLALLAAGRIDDALRDELAKVTIEAPSVTLSSDSGKLGATLVNGLDQPVTVKVEAITDGDLTLEGDTVRQLGPRARSVVRFEATTTQPGLHNVRLIVSSVDGVPLGSVDELPIRAAQVSTLIWIVIVAGGLVLFGMIGYRLPGQIRARRRELAAAAQGAPAGGPSAETGVGRP